MQDEDQVGEEVLGQVQPNVGGGHVLEVAPDHVPVAVQHGEITALAGGK